MFNDYGLNGYDTDPPDPHQLDHDTRDDADTHEELDEWAWLTNDN